MVTSGINSTRNEHDGELRSCCNPTERADRSVLKDSHALHVENHIRCFVVSVNVDLGQASEEAAMQDVIGVSTVALGGSEHSHESRPDPMDHDAAAANRTAARSPAATTQPICQVTARDVHPGDVVQQFDWPLHVRAVALGQTAVQITVTEFDFPLHYPADAKIQLAA